MYIRVLVYSGSDIGTKEHVKTVFKHLNFAALRKMITPIFNRGLPVSVVKTKPKLSLQKPADRQSNESIRLEFIKDRAEAKREI